jgi:hypothetical protein
MTTFPHIIKHKNKYGYIFARTVDNINAYIFKEFDQQEKFERSIFEISPIYEKDYSETKTTNSLKTFINLLERKETKKRGENRYLNSLIFDKVSKSDKKTKGVQPLEEIKRLDPIENHKNDGDYVAIEFRNFYQNRMWLRETRLNRKKQNKDKKILQFRYGQDCSTFKRNELLFIINTLWNKIPNNDFKKTNKDLYENISNSRSGFTKKEVTCGFVKKMTIYMNNKKIENKIWYKMLEN